jgi:uncharacterized protein YciI
MSEATRYVLLYDLGENYPAAREHFPAHRARYQEFMRRGVLLSLGPFTGSEGAMAIFTSREAAEEFAGDDPFVLNSVVGKWHIREWREATASHWHDLAPELHPEPYVFAVVPEVPGGIAPFAVIREDEGLTVVLLRADADRAGLRYDYVAARISLRLASDLAAVGLTAAVSRVLASAGISCNVIAGAAHDHFLTDWDRREQALALLASL